MIPQILTQIGLPLLVRMVSETLSQIDTPVTKGASRALEEVDQALKNGLVNKRQMEEANRHIERLAVLQSEETRANLAQINKSLRAEIASQDLYVRRMRPTFGYLMAITWGAQMLGLAYVIVFETEKAGLILNAMSSLSAIWAVGLSVLGVYVYKRSEDKKHASPPHETIFWNSAKK